MRPLGDDEVDRSQMYAWRHVESSDTNGPLVFFDKKPSFFANNFCDFFFRLSKTSILQKDRVLVVLATGVHPTPFRTRKLSLSAPMVLGPLVLGE